MQHSKTKKLMISVVLCTYNRAELFAQALGTLCEQDIETDLYEILIVDNNSRDNTAEIAQNYCRKHSNIRYVVETRQGLSHARNRGWQEAKGLYVAYVDDDCKMPASWLTVALEIINKISPAVFGGPYLGFYNSSKPNWWKDSYGDFEQAKESRSLFEHEYLRGGNIFLRRKLLEDMKGFDIDLGMSGQALGYGEETHLQNRIRAKMPGEIIYYEPRLFNYHLVRSEKMGIAWSLYSHFVNGKNSRIIFCKPVHRTGRSGKVRLVCQIFMIFFKLKVSCITGVVGRDRRHYPYFNNYLYENTSKYFAELGALYNDFFRKMK